MIAYSYYRSDPRVMRAAEAAVEAGFRVDFLALGREDDSGCEIVRGVFVHHLVRKKYRGSGHFHYGMAYGGFFFRSLWKGTCLACRRRYCVAHVNNMPDFLVFSTILPRLLGAKVILDIHDPMPNTFASKFGHRDSGFFFHLLLWQERLSAWYSHRVITVHEPVRDGVLVKHGLSRASVSVIANFPDIELFTRRASYEINETVRLVFHGTILERSGLRTLVLALAASDHRDRFRLTIIGEGDFSSTLKQLIQEHGLTEIVNFDNRMYPVREIPLRIAHADVGIVPLEISSITNYALPLKLLEYVAMGLPVVTVRSAAILHYFREDDCIFFDWNSSESLRRVFDRIAAHPEMLHAYYERSAMLREKYSWNTEKRKYIAMLRELSALPVPATELKLTTSP